MKHKTLQSTKVTLQTVSHEVNLRMYDTLFKKIISGETNC